MFKRLGRQSTSPSVDPASLLPPSPNANNPAFSPTSTSRSLEQSRPTSPSPNSGYFDSKTLTIGTFGSIDRPALQKSLKALEVLLIELNEYRELKSKLAKCEKRIGKACKELANSLDISSKSAQSPGRDALEVGEVIYSSLNATATFYDTLSEVSVKYSKALQKDYDDANDACAKSFKKIAKEEKSNDELLSSLDTKLKKASLSYDKTRNSNSAPDSSTQTKYLSLLNSLSAEMSIAKQRHAALMALRRVEVAVEVARVMSAVGEGDWKRTCEGIRKCGKNIGGLMEWGNYCTLGVGRMLNVVPGDFDFDKEKEKRDSVREESIVNSTEQIKKEVTFVEPMKKDSTIRPLPTQPKSPPLPSSIRQTSFQSETKPEALKSTPSPPPALNNAVTTNSGTHVTQQSSNAHPVSTTTADSSASPIATTTEDKPLNVWAAPRTGRTFNGTSPESEVNHTPAEDNHLQRPDPDRSLPPMSSSPKIVNDDALPPQYSPGMAKQILREKEGRDIPDFASSNNASSTSGSGISNAVPPTPRDDDQRPRFDKVEIDSMLRKGFQIQETENDDGVSLISSPILGATKFWDVGSQRSYRSPPPPTHVQQQQPLQQQQRLPPPQQRAGYHDDLPRMPSPHPIPQQFPPQPNRRHTMDPYSMSQQSGFSQNSYSGPPHQPERAVGVGRNGGGVERTLSMESTESSRSFVAEMKRRYAQDRDARAAGGQGSYNSNSRRVSSPPIPMQGQMGRVADLANRYASPPIEHSYPSSTTSSRHLPRHSTSAIPPPKASTVSYTRDDRRLSLSPEEEYHERNRRYSNSNLQTQRNLDSLMVEEQERERYGGSGGGAGSGSHPGSRPHSAQDGRHPPNCGCFRCTGQVIGNQRERDLGMREFGTMERDGRYYEDQDSRYSGSNFSRGGHRRE